MGDKSKIEWTDASWNPLAAFDRITGKRGWFCTKISDGCRNYYAERVNRRLGNGYEYTTQNLSNVRFELVNLDQPLRWTRPRLIFVNSMTDLFGDFVSDDIIADVFNVMHKSPRHIFQVLTKRPERMLDWISRSAFLSNDPIRNVWLGVSWLNDDSGEKIDGSEWIDRMGKKAAGRLLDGREWNEYPSSAEGGA